MNTALKKPAKKAIKKAVKKATKKQINISQGVFKEWKVIIPPRNMFIKLAITADISVMADRGLALKPSTHSAGLFQSSTPKYNGDCLFGTITLYSPYLQFSSSLVVHECFHAIQWLYRCLGDLAYDWASPEKFTSPDVFICSPSMLKEEAMAHQLHWLYDACIDQIKSDPKLGDFDVTL